MSACRDRFILYCVALSLASVGHPPLARRGFLACFKRVDEMGLGSEARHLGYAVDGQGGGGCQQPLGLGET